MTAKARGTESKTGNPVADLTRIAHGNLQGHVGALELGDVLARLMLEDEEGRGEPELRTIARHLPICVWSVDAELVIRSCFGRAMRRLGLEDGDLDGTPVSAWGSAGEENVRRALEGQAVEFESEGVLGERPWSMKTYLTPKPEGGVIAVSVDTTERYLVERELAESEGRLRGLAEAAPVGIYLADTSGANIYTNPELQRQFGLPAEETLGMAWLAAVHPDDRGIIEAWRQGDRPPGERYDVEYRVIRPDGAERWLRVMAHRLLDEEGNHTGYVGTTEDVTDRRADQLTLVADEERFRTIAESAPIGIFLSDPRNQLTFANPKFVQILGLADGSGLGAHNWVELVHPDDRERVYESIGEFLAGGDLDVSCRIIRAGGGEERWIHTSAVSFVDDGQFLGSVGTLVDITDARGAEERLRESEEVTRAILETAAEGIVTTDEFGTVQSFNTAAQRIFGWSAGEMIGESVGKLLAPPYRDVYLGYLRHYRDTGETTLSNGPVRELPGLRSDGSTVPVELAVTKVSSRGQVLFTALVRDISERKEFERQLEHQATHDPLTSLPNRAILAAQLENALARAYRHHASVAVLFVSLDRVKVVTDSLGHRAGDELRMAASHRLQGVVRPADTVTRFGEDEFVVLAEDLEDVGDAVDIAQRIVDAMDMPFDLTIDEAFISCHVGIAFAVEGLGTAESLIADADLAMFRAREKGSGQYEIFDTEMRAWINDRRKTEVALRHALDGSEFELHYQPIVEVGSGSVKGFEALIRWNRGAAGTTLPGEFIPVAEDSGLIVPIGEWVLQEACRQIATWQRQRPDQHLSVSVNLSGRQLAQRDIADVVARSLAGSRADPSRLVLEITETVLLDDVEQAARTLGALKDIGVSLSMDDFGTGYSSLTYLRRFPIDVVKIDRSFVSKLGTDSRDASIVKTVILLANGLELGVVAEGVETEDQLEALTAMGCRYAQGYYFSRPQPVKALSAFLP